MVFIFLHFQIAIGNAMSFPQGPRWRDDWKLTHYIGNNISNRLHIFKIIEEGYKIDFTHEPPPFAAKNNQSSLNQPKFVDEAIHALVKNQCVRECPTVPHCCNPLTVATGWEKLRLVLDLRHVNEYTNMKHFKYEDLSTFVELFEHNDYLGTFDLKSGYHHVQIHLRFWKYLGFRWVFLNGEEKYYEFLVLPFGLNIAGYIFTKTMRPLVKKWELRA